MKKSILLLVSTLLTILSSEAVCQESWSEVLKKEEGTLGIIYYQQPGLIQKDNTGELSGLCIAILNDFADFVHKKYGKKITIKYVAEEPVFSSFLEKIKTTPNIVGLGNITITPERKKFIQFTESYLTNPVILLSHKSAPDITALDQCSEKFKDYTALVIGQSTHELYMASIKKKYFPTLAVKKISSGLEVMDEMTKNPKSFGIIDLTEYIYAVRSKLPLKRHAVKITEKNEELGFAMQLNNDWQMPWKEFLTPEYKQSIKYRKHIVNNLGSSFLSLVEM
ncbi:ABC transporter substrate-binding protein [Chryseotalea sanaruensis]|uniref:ABC transporter substrate-binding protein n=1 Tax=Chryseotalea sanaruensis TaxID=2482724 RepID=A0A401UAC1_9BACT|nr:transporter substrate-binding domain-containing protein [Chryseotalea sanaruensis]GCC51830.1 ABC transporter substrate-binding protein [Chryseotalea sanaruensis]